MGRIEERTHLNYSFVFPDTPTTVLPSSLLPPQQREQMEKISKSGFDREEKGGESGISLFCLVRVSFDIILTVKRVIQEMPCHDIGET